MLLLFILAAHLLAFTIFCILKEENLILYERSLYVSCYQSAIATRPLNIIFIYSMKKFEKKTLSALQLENKTVHFVVWCVDSLKRWRHKPRSVSDRSTKWSTSGNARWLTFRPSWKGHSVTRALTPPRSTNWGRSWRRVQTQLKDFAERTRIWLVNTSQMLLWPAK